MRHIRAHRPGPGQRSVWDHPSPPIIEPVEARIRVRVGGLWLADTSDALQVLETGHPPAYFIPTRDVMAGMLDPGAGSERCPWKGRMAFWDAFVDGSHFERVAWSHPDPPSDYEALADHLAFFLDVADEGWVDEVQAKPQPGGFFGGWITPDLAGPYKGEPGSAGW